MSSSESSLVTLAPDAEYSKIDGITLAKHQPISDSCPTGNCGDNHPMNIRYGNLLGLVLWFVIITIVVIIILALWGPAAVQVKDSDGNPTGDVDTASVIVSSIIIAFIIVAIIYLIRSANYFY